MTFCGHFCRMTVALCENCRPPFHATNMYISVVGLPFLPTTSFSSMFWICSMSSSHEPVGKLKWSRAPLVLLAVSLALLVFRFLAPLAEDVAASGVDSAGWDFLFALARLLGAGVAGLYTGLPPIFLTYALSMSLAPALADMVSPSRNIYKQRRRYKLSSGSQVWSAAFG